MQESKVGVVVIGRNEGQRLVDCLDSIARTEVPLVYVDSGSSDESVSNARKYTEFVIELDPAFPFTAARGRNEGASLLVNSFSEIEFVQFIDGDCTLASDFLAKAQTFLNSTPDAAVVFGNRKELYPNKSIYNKMCDIEFSIPPGEVESCGGDSMMRVEDFQSVNGFDPSLIAGEEPELCFRLRENGKRIFSIDEPMTFHDANILDVSAFLQRVRRGGFAAAKGFYLHGSEGFEKRAVFRIVFWGAVLPLAIVLLAAVLGAQMLLLFLVYPVQILRVGYRLSKTKNILLREGLVCASFWVLGKTYEFLGLLDFLLEHLSGKHREIIEYK